MLDSVWDTISSQLQVDAMSFFKKLKDELKEMLNDDDDKDKKKKEEQGMNSAVGRDNIFKPS